MREGRRDAQDDRSVFCVNKQVEVEPLIKTGNSKKA